MENYYYVATALPPLQFGVTPEMTFADFCHLLEDNLDKEDYLKTVVLRRYYDIENIRAFWKKQPLDPRGNYNEVDLESAILSHEGLPEYVYDFLDKYDSKERRLEYFPELIVSYFQNEIKKAKGFLKRYLEFEREWRLVFTAFRAKQLGRDINVELQFEDPYDDFVAQILAQKDAKSFVPPNGYQELAAIFEEHANDPLALHKALGAYRFYHIEDMLGIDMFTIDRILGYMAELITLEKWFELDKKKGIERVDHAVGA